MSFTYSAGGATPQPTLAWTFDGTTTPYIGSATTSVTGTVTYVSGKYLQSISYTNSATGTPPNNYLSISYTPGPFNLDLGFSYSVWFKINARPASGNRALLTFNGSVTNYTSYLQYDNSLITPRYFNGSTTYIPTGTTYTVGEWIHVTTTFIGGTMSFYINGAFFSSTTYTQIGSTLSSSFFIGRGGGLNDGSIATIDDLRIFNTALTAAQVQSIYNQQGMPGQGKMMTTSSYIANGLVAYYDTQNPNYPNSVSGTTWYDISGNGRSVTIRPGSSYNASGKYITFDGTIDSGTTAAETGQNLTQWTVMCVFMRTANGVGYSRLAGASPAPDAGEIALVGGTLAINSPESFGWNFTSFGASAGVWYHMCVAFDTTTTGVVDTWVYINGALVNSYIIDGTVQNPTGYTMGIKSDFSNNEAMIGRMSLFAIYNKVLSQSEVSANYNFYKKTNISATLTGTPLFRQLSPSATSSAVGAFSLRAVNGTTAKAVQVRNGTTSATQDFYTDRLGNLLTAPVTGQSLAKWLGGATGYVATWYDQSGKGSHMSCSSTAIQPKIDLVNKWIDFKTTAYFDVSATPSTGPVPWNNTKNYTVLCRHNSIQNSAGGICGCSNAAPTYNTTGYTNNFRANLGGSAGQQYYNYWFFRDFNAGTYAIGNKLTWKWDGANRYMYTNGTLNATQAQLSTDWLQTSSFAQMIGKTTADATMNGEMYSIFMFDTALSDADRNLVENFS